MDKLLDLLKSAAPALATAVMGPAGGAVLTAIAGKLGVPPLVSEVTAALEANPDMMLKLKEIDLETFKLENADRDSARASHAAIATSANAVLLEKLTPPILALGTVGLAFLLIGLLIFANIPDSQENIIIYALGFITSAATQVLGFYFGSSQGSKDKSNALTGLHK